MELDMSYKKACMCTDAFVWGCWAFALGKPKHLTLVWAPHRRPGRGGGSQTWQLAASERYSADLILQQKQLVPSC